MHLPRNPNRRSFLRRMVLILSGVRYSSLLPEGTSGKTAPSLRKAIFYESVKDQNAQCFSVRGNVLSVMREGTSAGTWKNQNEKLYTIVLIKRMHFIFLKNYVKGCFCPFCNEKIPGI